MNSCMEILRLDKIRLKTEDVIYSMSKDELLYIHLHLYGIGDEDSILNDYKLPLSLDDFARVKKLLKLKKLKSQEMAKDIIGEIRDFFGDDYKWFKFAFLESPLTAMSMGKVYAALYSYLIEACSNEVEKSVGSRSKYSEYLSKLSEANTATSGAMNFLKSLFNFGISGIKDGLFNGEVDVSTFRETMLVAALNSYWGISNSYIYEYESFKGKNEKTISEYKEQINNKHLKIKELSNEIKANEKQNKLLEKIGCMSDIFGRLDNIDKSVSNLGVLSEKTLSEMKTQKSETIKSVLSGQVDSMVGKVSELKSNLAIKSLECRTLKRELEEYQTSIGKYAREYIVNNKDDESLKEDIISIFDIGAKGETESIEYNDVLEKEVKDDEPQKNVVSKSCKMGIVDIVNGVHNIKYQDGSSCELKGIPEKVYLCRQQFVIATVDDVFLKTTSSRYDDNGIDISDLMLGTVEQVEPLRIRTEYGHGYVECKSVQGNAFLKNNQVLGVNEHMEVVRAFKLVKFGADTLMESIKAKGQDIYFVLKVLPSGILVRNIETGIEDMKMFDVGDVVLREHSIIFEKEGCIVNAMSSSKFYTMSSYYKDKVSIGAVEFSDDGVKFKRQNGELVYIQNIPDAVRLDKHDVVSVDEFNNYLTKICTEPLENKVVISKKTPRQVVGDTKPKRGIDVVGEVTIVGNLKYQNAYNLAFIKQGYKVNMLDGYNNNVDRIMQVAKNSDAIIIVSSYCSHENFWGVKDRLKGCSNGAIRFIAGQDDGANMLVKKFLDGVVEEKVKITN